MSLSLAILLFAIWIIPVLIMRWAMGKPGPSLDLLGRVIHWSYILVPHFWALVALMFAIVGEIRIAVRRMLL